MPIDQKNISQRLDELIQSAQSGDAETVGEVTSGTITILEKLYVSNLSCSVMFFILTE